MPAHSSPLSIVISAGSLCRGCFPGEFYISLNKQQQHNNPEQYDAVAGDS